MLDYTLKQIADATGGSLVRGEPGRRVESVIIDSRTAEPGAVFFALPGERVDGHDFVEAAAARGCSGAVVSRVPGCEQQLPAGFGLVLVDDVLRALGALAAWHRRFVRASVVGVTGSAGKTTTKDMIAAVLSAGFRVVATSGNMNNEIGLPLTLMELTPEHQVAVVEMAMRAQGEITALSRIACPDVGVITNVGSAHIGLLGSKINIAAAKAELIEALPPHGFAVLNGDDVLVRPMAELVPRRALLYGLSEGCLFRADNIGTEAGSISFDLDIEGHRVNGVRFSVPLPGRHNLHNALAALAVGWRLGLEPNVMAMGLASFSPSPMRMEFSTSPAGFTVINDAYNANPASVKCAVDAALQYARGRRVILAFGDMLELGEESIVAHENVGRHAARAGVAGLVTVGEMAAYAGKAVRLLEGEERQVAAALRPDTVEVVECKDNLGALQALAKMVCPGDVILIKGSRGMEMEEIAEGLLEAPGSGGM
jgi:UDP-N-acetylmuramoyl-tripeptide--D-alanyl-D-alanine ligase